MKRRRKSTSFILSCLANDVSNIVQCVHDNIEPGERHIGYVEGKLAAFRIANIITDEEYELLFDQLVTAGVTQRFSYESLYSASAE